MTKTSVWCKRCGQRWAQDAGLCRRCGRDTGAYRLSGFEQDALRVTRQRGPRPLRLPTPPRPTRVVDGVEYEVVWP
jgi:hypothetical protein